MYSNIKSRILLDGKYSMAFCNYVDVLQGEIISPLLFSLYINDVVNEFLINGVEAIELQQLSIFLLLYADDMVLFSETIGGLQSMLDTLACYSDKWSLTGNVNKRPMGPVSLTCFPLQNYLKVFAISGTLF